MSKFVLMVPFCFDFVNIFYGTIQNTDIQSYVQHLFLIFLSFNSTTRYWLIYLDLLLVCTM